MAKTKSEKNNSNKKHHSIIEQKFHVDITYDSLYSGDYVGTIYRCRIEARGEYQYLVLEIKIDDFNQIFRSKHRLPLFSYSGLNGFFEELMGYNGGDIECCDLIGLRIWFEIVQVKKNGSIYCNIKKSGLLDDDDDDDNDDDDDDDN